MMTMHKLIGWLGGAALLLGMPLLGVWLTDAPLAPYLEMPPRTTFVSHAAFSWPVFWGLAAFIIFVMGPFVWRVLRSPSPTPAPAAPFPWWGWCALAFGLSIWILAWNRFSWFHTLQPFTFTPLWLSYIVVMNALAFRRTGLSPLTHRPLQFLALFPISALFWWFFEYLNRFVQNWHYIGIGTLSAEEYIFRAMLPFATVLPAFVATRAWLSSYPRLTAGLSCWRPFSVSDPRRLAWLALILAAAGLVGISLWPELLFPLLWISPLIVVASIRILQGKITLLNAPAHGNWAPLFLAAMAALVCGVFWEMWNFYSLEKWIYTVPYVARFHLFEMPLLGFAGYLPFGIECALVAEWVGFTEKAPPGSDKPRPPRTSPSKASTPQGQSPAG